MMNHVCYYDFVVLAFVTRIHGRPVFGSLSLRWLCCRLQNDRSDWKCNITIFELLLFPRIFRSASEGSVDG